MNLALFDFDGTITTTETFPAFMRLAVPPLRKAVGRVALAPLIAAYRLGTVSGRTIRAAIVRVGLHGAAECDIRACGEDFAREVLPGVIRPIALDRIHWHQARGDTVAVVSASLDLYLDVWCRGHGVDVICSALETHNGRLTGRYRGADCCGAEKVTRIRLATISPVTLRSTGTATPMRISRCLAWRVTEATAGRPWRDDDRRGERGWLTPPPGLFTQNIRRRPICVWRGKFTWLAVSTTPKLALFGSVFGAP